MADLTYRFGSEGADKLAGDFRKVADTEVLAARGARLLKDALEKQRKATDVSAGASIALAKADEILEEAEHGLADGALEAEFALKKQADAAKKAAAGSAAAGVAAKGAGGGFSALASPMGAAVAAGTILSPVLVTLGVGLAGFGLAAAGVAKPIADAAAKTGGLRANLKSLDPEQQAVARGILGLGKEYDQFQKALQPEVLTVFNQGIKIAGSLLHDVQPVAEATGKALGVMLGRIDAEFKSGTWKQFFTFMADTAGTDMKLLTDNFTGLLNVLPTLLEDLQPLAQGFLETSDNALKLAGSIANFGKSTDKTSNSVGTNTGLLGFLSKAVENVTSFMKPGGVAAGALKAGLDGIPGSAGRAGASLGTVAGHAQTLAGQLNADRAAVDALTASENKALSPLLAYSAALVTQHNDAASLNTALKASHDRIGLNTAAQRASFGAANTYIQDLLNTASAAVKSHQGIDAQIGSIQGALPLLRNVKGGTRQYWQEVSTLVGWLHKLQAIKLIQEAIHVNASGVWSVTPGKIGLPGGTAGGPFAYGGAVSGGVAGRDSVPAMLMPGEVVVPTNMVRAGAVDHLRGSLPGFASGGVVGSWPKLPGLGPWAVRELGATEHAVARSTAAALVAGIKAAQSAGAAGAQGGPTSASAAQAQAYARSRLGAYGWGAAQMKFLIELWTRESGWNRLARNPSSGAYGIPQALPPGKMGAAANPPTSSAAAQINWGLGYIKGRYSSPQNAWSHELSFNWYKHGGLVPGYASGGSVSKQGSAYLKAWQTKRGSGAHGPVVLNEQIARLAAAAGRAQALAGARGLSPGQHRFWASAAAGEKKRLGVLRRELTAERAWRDQLGLGELSLAREIRAAGNLPSLAGPVRGWKAQLGRDKARAAAVSKMLGYSSAYLAAHKPPPKVTPPGVPGSIPHTGVYTDSTADLIAQLFAAGASSSRVVTLDSGGWLMPGVQAVANKTGRPEQVLPPGRGGRGGGDTYNFNFPHYVGSRDDLVRALSDLKRQGRLPK